MAVEDADVVVDEGLKTPAGREGKAEDSNASVEVTTLAEQERKGEGGSASVEVTTPEPPKETCEDKTASNKVQVSQGWICNIKLVILL